MSTRTPRPLRTLSALYFLSYCPSGIVFPIFPLMLAGRGLGAIEISIVMVMNPIMNLLTPPIWSALADTLHASVALLRLVMFASALSVLLLFPRWGLVGAMVAMTVFCTFRSTIPSLLDAATHAELGQKVIDYAKVRVWGSVAFAICAGIAGVLDGFEHAEIVVLIASAAFIAGGFVAFGLDAPPMRREPAVVNKTIAFIRSAKLVPIFVANAFYYEAHSVFDVHFSLFLGSLDYRDLVGPSWMLAVFCEVGLMFAAPKLLKARDPKNVVVFCAAVATLRWFLLSFVRDRSLVFAIQALHGITFGVWFLSLVREVQSRAPEALRSSVQAALLTSMGIGTVFGYFFGGIVFDALGGAWLWRITALTAGVSLAIYAFASRREATGERRA